MRGIAIALCVLSWGGIGMGQTSKWSPSARCSRGIESCTRPTWPPRRRGDLIDRLWDEDAVLLQPGQAPIVGKTAF